MNFTYTRQVIAGFHISIIARAFSRRRTGRIFSEFRARGRMYRSLIVFNYDGIFKVRNVSLHLELFGSDDQGGFELGFGLLRRQGQGGRRVVRGVMVSGIDVEIGFGLGQMRHGSLVGAARRFVVSGRRIIHLTRLKTGGLARVIGAGSELLALHFLPLEFGSLHLLALHLRTLHLVAQSIGRRPYDLLHSFFFQSGDVRATHPSHASLLLLSSDRCRSCRLLLLLQK